jgi:hypothetical protein
MVDSSLQAVEQAELDALRKGAGGAGGAGGLQILEDSTQFGESAKQMEAQGSTILAASDDESFEKISAQDRQTFRENATTEMDAQIADLEKGLQNPNLSPE